MGNNDAANLLDTILVISVMLTYLKIIRLYGRFSQIGKISENA